MTEDTKDLWEAIEALQERLDGVEEELKNKATSRAKKKKDIDDYFEPEPWPVPVVEQTANVNVLRPIDEILAEALAVNRVWGQEDATIQAQNAMTQQTNELARTLGRTINRTPRRWTTQPILDNRMDR